MKNLFTLFCITAVVLSANAQKVFDYSNGPKNPNGTDLIYGVVLTSIDPAKIVEAEDHHWDLSDMVLSTYVYSSVWAPESVFAGATHSNVAYIDIAPGVSYETNLMVSIDNSGIKTVGERLARQAFQVGSNFSDSIVVLAQDVTYATPQIRMPYPATMGTKWNATTTAAYDLSITFNPLYNNTPGQRKTIITSTHEVVGHGVMNVKRTDGKPAGMRRVLMVKNTVTTVDSFFINGNPAPPQLLAQAGIQQGETNTVYQRTFWRQYEVMPLLNVTYETAAFATIKDVNVHSQRLPWPDNVEDVVVDDEVNIFPNPCNGTFTISMPGIEKGEYTYSVVDGAGRTVQTGVLDMHVDNGQVELSLNEAAPGNYFIQMTNDDVVLKAKKIVVQ